MQIAIGNRVVGHGRPTFVVAEMSGNHGGSLERALQIVRAAKRVGADAVKLQTYTADTITLKSDREDFLLPADSPWAAERTLWSLYDKASTPWAWHARLFEEARALGLEIFSSPFDESAVDFLEALHVPAYKIASPEITHVPLLEKVGATGKPVIISTGVADVSDIELALSVLRDSGASEIIALKCTTAYPAPARECNLLTIPDLMRRFGVLSGLSDHSMGTAIAVASVALGACVIEKHFTLDDADETVESFFSSGEAEFARLVSDVRLVEEALGRPSYEITESAVPNLRGRRSLYVCAPVKAGQPIPAESIRTVRPALGLHPKHLREVIGRRAKRDLQPGDRVTWDALE